MLLPQHSQTQDKKRAAAANAAQRQADLLRRSMNAAANQNMVGHTLLTRPDLAMQRPTRSPYNILTATDHMSDEEMDGALHSPMLYIAGDTEVKGEACYIMIMLNAPECAYTKLGQIYPFAAEKYRKIPVFSGGDTPRNPCHKSGYDPICLLVRSKCDRHFHIIESPDEVQAALYNDDYDQVLAFRGHCLMTKKDVHHHLALSDLFVAEKISTNVFLSPYAESKYFMAFQENGFCLQDIAQTPQWARQDRAAYSYKQ